MGLNSMRARMTALFSFTIALVMLLSCGGLIGYARYAAERGATERLNAAARRAQTELTNGDHSIDPSELREEERNFASENLALMIVDGKGRIVERSQNRVPSWPRTREDGWRVRSVPVGGYMAVIGLPWEPTEKALKAQALGFVAISLLVILAAAIGAWLLVGRTLSPIGSLARQAQTASPDRLRLHLSPPSQDAEIVDLVATLNDLLGRLSQTAAAKGRFYAAASHELRTPLQALSGHLELSLSKSRTNEERHATIREAYAQSQRLVSLVCDLLTLNRLEFAASLPTTEPVCLAELCARALAHFRPVAEQRALRVRSSLPECAEILAPRSHVEMLVRNLIENAMKYATPGGGVCVELTGSQLTIFNAFPASPRLDAEHLFEPFFRPDASRNSETGGNGLGLAICRAVAVANGWKLTLEQDENGVSVTTLFPEYGLT
jgi:two-component system OmpR family sensor kinase